MAFPFPTRLGRCLIFGLVGQEETVLVRVLFRCSPTSLHPYIYRAIEVVSNASKVESLVRAFKKGDMSDMEGRREDCFTYTGSLMVSVEAGVFN
jgi:hypothetical protein